MSSVDIQDFVDSIRKDEVRLFDEVFEAHYDMLCRFAMSYLESGDHAEEIVQAVFVQIWEGRKSIDIKSSLRSYLFTAVRNRCLNEIKRQKTQHIHHEGIAATSSVSYQEDSVERRELSDRISTAIAALPTERQRIFKMCKIEGKKYHEIAEELDISVKTVESQMGKALKQLRVELGGVVPAIFYLSKWCLNWFLNNG